MRKFPVNEQKAKAVSALLSAAAAYRPGEMMHWSVIEETVGATRADSYFWNVVKKFRDIMLKERLIGMRPQKNVGLMLLPPHDQIRICAEDRHRKMFRQSTRAMKELTHVNEGALSIHDMRLRLSQMDRLKQERRTIRASVKEVIKTTETMPLRSLPQTV